MTETQSEIYIEKLKDLDPQALKFACEKCIEELSFFPKIAEILERVNPTDPAEAVKAWEAALESNYTYHPDTRPNGGWNDLDSKARFALHVIGGPDAIFQNWNDAKQMGFLRRDFLAAYGQVNAGEKAFALPSETLKKLAEDARKQLGGKTQ